MSLTLEAANREPIQSKPSPTVAKASPGWLKLVGQAVADAQESARPVADPAVRKPAGPAPTARQLSDRLQASRPSATAPASAARSSTWSMAGKVGGIGDVIKTLQGDDGQEEVRTAGQVATTFEQNMEALDTANGGKKDGVFGSKDLERIANDPKASQELREAAQQVLDDPNLYHALDVGDGKGLDDKISLADLNQVEANEGFQSGRGKQSFTDVRDELSHNFDTFDSASNGKKDGIISQDDLKKVASDESRSESERKLAQKLLDDPNYWNAFDVADGRKKDGKVSKEDLSQVGYSPSVEEVSRDTWSDADAAALDRALANPQINQGDLFAGFSQTDNGNCVSTAIIKAAVDRYGNQIFESVQKGENGGYTVTLQDGKTVRLTREEMEATTAGTHYNAQNPEQGAYATLAYAVMAKQAQNEGHDGSRTFGEALVSLANGENPAKTPDFLGLGDKVKRVDIQDVPGMSGVVAWGDGHCVYVDTLNGHTYGDAWGTRRDYDGGNYVDKDSRTDIQKIGQLQDAFVFV